ncbi:pirin family protein [Segetibacter sp.]|jgi:redox-sensitive bicupin YhaK (pirin superfamily)|uniref:pirin family protein n=1 Tax=Segetibacter sp. TaxID=2231182 RepID=UPI0026125D18|nr:pirin family protein [Segetibacter sp.]MCW3080574.1 pirin family protein [Segetibacter sp.]
MKTIKAQHKAVCEPIGDLVTYRAMPTHTVPMNLIDPFIFLNHHGWQQYEPNNNGLPFGPHPHRGFETITFILEGDLTHKDTTGVVSVIKEGGVQWMTAGKGLIHAEISSPEFKTEGGPLEILQLWVNLPAKYKMTEPKYIGLQKTEIPVAEYDNGKVAAHIVSGEWNDVKGPFNTLTDIHLSYMYFKVGGKYTTQVPKEQNIFLYIVKGEMKVNGDIARLHHLVEFNRDGQTVEMKATADSIILFGYATPFNEPFFAYGPFVMNTREEIMQAYDDMKNGKFGDEQALLD